MSSPVAWERWGMADRDCRRAASLKLWVVAWVAYATISCRPALWASSHSWWLRRRTLALRPQYRQVLARESIILVIGIVVF